jgi:predicted PurR-regulated permease PerM
MEDIGMTPQGLSSSSDITRTTLAVLFIAALIVSTFWVVRPFLSAFLWATVIVISTWPFLLGLQRQLGRRGLATAVMTLALLLVLIIPLGFAAATLLGNVHQITVWTRSVDKLVLPPAPDWVARIPLLGSDLSVAWQNLAVQLAGDESARTILPYAGRFLSWFAGQLGGVGAMILQFLLTVVIAAILYTNGETAASGVRRFVCCLAGPHGEKAADLATGSIRGVATGVVATAVLQTLIAGIGLIVVSVPGALLLASAILILSLAQLGPFLIMLPVVVWKFLSGEPFWGGVLLLFALVSGMIDNIVRPILIKRGADLPLTLIFAGVIGGMISFGIMGIFIGPVVLSVAYTLLHDWVEYTESTQVLRVTDQQSAQLAAKSHPTTGSLIVPGNTI